MAFHGKVALVTGAASGMGRVAAQRLASQGVAVAAVDINEEALESLSRENETVRTWPIDVTDRKAVESVVDRVESESGPIDRVVNAAGIMPTSRIIEQDVDEIHRVIAVNFSGVVNVTMATFPRMVARGSGDFVQFGSIAGFIPNLYFGAYAASKAAVVSFTEVLREENRKSGVRLVCVCPGVVDTPLQLQVDDCVKMPEQSRKLPPEQILDAVERGLEKGRFFVFGDWQTAVGWRIRRFLPRALWTLDHRVEGF